MTSIFVLSLGVAAATWAAPSQTAPSQTAPTLNEVLKQHYRAIGGVEAWRRVASVRWQADLVIEPPGLEGSITTIAGRPDKAWVEILLKGTTAIQALDGDKAWWHAPLFGASLPVVAPPARDASLRLAADVDGPLVDWKKSEHRLQLVGVAVDAGTELIELELTRATGDTARLFLDAETYLLSKAIDLDEKQSVTRYGNYRDVDGLQVAFFRQIEPANGRHRKLTITSWEVNVPLDDSLFLMPVAETAGREVAASGAGGEVSSVAKFDAGTGGIARDTKGNLYSADFGAVLGDRTKAGKRVWRITADGAATVFAEGFVGASGNAFNSKETLFQANIGGSTISAITTGGVVTEFASDGLENPVGIVIDREDTLFVANCGGGSIQRIDRHGKSSRFAEHPLLACPNGIAMDEERNLYVSNFYNGDVVRVSHEGEVTRLATLPGSNNGHVTYSKGKLYVVARGAHRIYSVTLTGDFSVVAGSGERGNEDGAALAASFCFPNDIVASADGSTLYVNDIADCSEDGKRLAPTVVRRIALPPG